MCDSKISNNSGLGEDERKRRRNTKNIGQNGLKKRLSAGGTQAKGGGQGGGLLVCRRKGINQKGWEAEASNQKKRAVTPGALAEGKRSREGGYVGDAWSAFFR